MSEHETICKVIEAPPNTKTIVSELPVHDGTALVFFSHLIMEEVCGQDVLKPLADKLNLPILVTVCKKAYLEFPFGNTYISRTNRQRLFACPKETWDKLSEVINCIVYCEDGQFVSFPLFKLEGVNIESEKGSVKIPLYVCGLQDVRNVYVPYYDGVVTFVRREINDVTAVNEQNSLIAALQKEELKKIAEEKEEEYARNHRTSGRDS